MSRDLPRDISEQVVQRLHFHGAVPPKGFLHDRQERIHMPETLSYEASLKRLEELVNQLESGKLSLEDSIAAYEEGKKLSQTCLERLKDAQNKIQLLLEKENGQIELGPLTLER